MRFDIRTRTFVLKTILNIASFLGETLQYLPLSWKMTLIQTSWHTIPSERIKKMVYATCTTMIKKESSDITIDRTSWKLDNYTARFALRLHLHNYVDRHHFFLDDNITLGKFLLNNLTKDDVYVDVGANIGHTTLIATLKAKYVLAFEPEPNIFKKLETNIHINKAKNIKAHQIALSDKSETAKLYICTDNDGSHSMDKTFMDTIGNTYTKPITIKTVRFDDLNLPTPTVIKIDVEGHEIPVLQGMKKTLPSVKYVILETSLPHLQKVKNILASHGFTTYKYANPKTCSFTTKENAVSQSPKHLLDLLFVNKKIKYIV